MEDLQPIYEVPSVQEKVRAVKKYISTVVRAKNFFGWRYFIEDLKVDIECEIYKYEDLHRQGKYKENGIGAYCTMAMQGAINYAAKCNALKRKINFEAISLDAVLETEKNTTRPIQLSAPKDDSLAQMELLMSIEQTFGEEIQELAKRVLEGECLSAKELARLRTSKMKLLLLDD